MSNIAKSRMKGVATLADLKKAQEIFDGSDDDFDLTFLDAPKENKKQEEEKKSLELPEIVTKTSFMFHNQHRIQISKSLSLVHTDEAFQKIFYSSSDLLIALRLHLFEGMDSKYLTSVVLDHLFTTCLDGTDLILMKEATKVLNVLINTQKMNDWKIPSFSVVLRHFGVLPIVINESNQSAEIEKLTKNNKNISPNSVMGYEISKQFEAFNFYLEIIADYYNKDIKRNFEIDIEEIIGLLRSLLILSTDIDIQKYHKTTIINTISSLFDYLVQIDADSFENLEITFQDHSIVGKKRKLEDEAKNEVSYRNFRILFIEMLEMLIKTSGLTCHQLSQVSCSFLEISNNNEIMKKFSYCFAKNLIVNRFCQNYLSSTKKSKLLNPSKDEKPSEIAYIPDENQIEESKKNCQFLRNLLASLYPHENYKKTINDSEEEDSEEDSTEENDYKMSKNGKILIIDDLQASLGLFEIIRVFVVLEGNFWDLENGRGLLEECTRFQIKTLLRQVHEVVSNIQIRWNYIEKNKTK